MLSHYFAGDVPKTEDANYDLPDIQFCLNGFLRLHVKTWDGVGSINFRHKNWMKRNNHYRFKVNPVGISLVKLILKINFI